MRKHRSFPRAKLSLDATLSGPNGQVVGEVTDGSRRGLFFKTDQPSLFPTDAAVKIRVKCSIQSLSLIHSESCIDIEGKVVHQGLKGVGIQIESMSHEMRQSWWNLLERALTGKGAQPQRVL
jgi:hypothetical protein